MRKADVILLLGHRLNPDGSPSDDMKRRVALAKSLYYRGVAGHVIPCGGRLPGQNRSEAEVMRELLTQSGVPESAITLENASTITIENIKNVKALMDGMGAKDAALVTSDYHVRRALKDCARYGIRAFGAGARTPFGKYWFKVHWTELRVRALMCRARLTHRDPHELAKEVIAKRIARSGRVK